MKNQVWLLAAGIASMAVAVPTSYEVAPSAQASSSRLYSVRIGVDTGWPALTVYAPVPGRLTIHEGDRVQFTNAVPAWPQTVTFGPIENTPALITNQRANEINPQVVTPQGGSTIGDVSLNVYSSGALMKGIKGLSNAYTFTFPNVGVYFYRSLFHPAATAEIDVVPAGKRASPVAADNGPTLMNVVRSMAQALEDEQPLERNNGGGGSTITISGGNRDVSLNKFTPSGMTVPVSTTLTWTINEANGDLHALVFGPRTDESAGGIHLYTGLAHDGGLLINPAYARASVASGAVLTMDTLHALNAGTGPRWTSGILYGSSPNSPSAVPTTYKLTFAVPGGYIYVDPFHPGMQGTINVIGPHQ